MDKLDMLTQNVSATELARRVGISRQSMTARLKTDDCKMSDLQEMAQALGCELVWDWVKKES